ncbi:ArnT family glycosyltransferase [Alkalinema pantanalense CENA528]|uniref:ArnT family glycosyltransferase n=1 Tax=Alkalinema pantanalense TaxID=1620705 RepID=UPI003D6E30B1
MKALQSSRWVPWIWIGLLVGIAFWYGLGSTGLLDETEPLFAEAARQMTVTGDWITPYFNGVTRFDKPPLIYWLMTIAYQTIGVNSWAARFPSALAATALVGFIFYIAQQWVKQGRSTPVASLEPKAETASPATFSPVTLARTPLSSIDPALPYLITAPLALNLQMLFFGRTGYSDMLLNLCFGGSILAFWGGYGQPNNPARQRYWYLGFWILMALGVLTKGPVAIVLPGAILVLLLLITGQWHKVWQEMPWKLGIGLLVAIALPWYILAYRANGQTFIDAFFGFHNVARFTQVVNKHSGPWYYHFLMVLGGFAPWSLALPAAIAQVIQQKTWKSTDRHHHLGLLALIWFGTVLGFFTIAQTKYITYSLPAIPAAAILVGLWWSQQRQSSSGKAQEPVQGSLQGKHLGQISTFAVTGLFAIAMAVAAWLCPNWLNGDPAMPNLGQQVAAFGLPYLGAAIWGVAAIAIFLAFLFQKYRRLWTINLAAMALFIALFVLPLLGLVDQERQLPLRQLAAEIRQVQTSGEPLIMAVNFFEKPSLVFYTQQPIVFINRSVKLRPELEQLQQSGTVKSALVVTTPKTLAEAQISADRYQSLATAGVYKLVRFPIS